jgi:ABC-type glycerol-3-phosphate transport system substrate-binding protein
MNRNADILNMKTSRILLMAAALFAAGCKNPVNLSGSYATPAQDVSGTVAITTNAVTVGGAYATTNESVGGAVTVGK